MERGQCGKALAKPAERRYGGRRRVGRLSQRCMVAASQVLGTVCRQGSHNSIDRKDRRRQVVAGAMLVGVMLLLGFFCHQPETHGSATPRAHLAHAGAEHCWSAIPSAPTLGLAMIFVALMSLTLPLQQLLLFISPFHPPRTFLPTGDRFTDL